ncbi:flavodoxin reductase [Neptunitalea chrysea]|uniref:Flavodoxin reductase n=1 Tax=Neptunitalea chrysea TaxID=1647581 RepID=A0A9W6EVG1_9FLAO|nr:ferredoxin--NADP reductase [Neptunitalea chrysea]GLB52881.1 flavodoxin reductase [Neptunitalea chrysea]
MNRAYKLTVKDLKYNTSNAVEIAFDVPSTLKNTFKFIPGQYITLEKELNGETLRRAYSICTDPTSRSLAIAIKRVNEGTFSIYANEVLKAGDVLDVFPPQGRFTYKPINTGNTIMAFAAGSGITPIISILKTVIYKTNNPFTLVYGSKSIKDCMFYEELMDLHSKFSNRLTIHFVFSQQKEPEADFGRIDSTVVTSLLNEYPSKEDLEAFYICGPETMMTTITDSLIENNIPKSLIYQELFTTDPLEPLKNVSLEEGMCTVKVTTDDEETTFVMNKKQTLLTAALANGVDAPYSCQGGICSSCIARVTTGKATMVKNQILTDDEIAEGFVLTCQAYPDTDAIEIDYDDV